MPARFNRVLWNGLMRGTPYPVLRGDVFEPLIRRLSLSLTLSRRGFRPSGIASDRVPFVSRFERSRHSNRASPARRRCRPAARFL